MTRQKNRSNEQQSRASIQAAEAVALGTMAGGLALGAVQAREAQPLPEDDVQVAAPVTQGEELREAQAPAEPVAEGNAPEADAAPAAAAVAAPASAQAQQAAEPSAETAPTAAPAIPLPAASASADMPAVPADTPAVDAPAAEQISGAIERLVTEVAKDTSTEGSALPLAGQILESVAEIVSTLKPGLDVSALSSLGSTLQAQVETVLEPTKGLLQDLPDSIGDTVETTLTGAGLGTIGSELADLPSALTQSVNAALGDTSLASLSDTIDLGGLPSSLLGNDGPVTDSGLLSNLFYSDGESDLVAVPSLVGQSVDSLQIPDLSDMASSIVADVADSGVGLLGLSYTDLSPDGFHPASGGIGGLSLL